MTKLNHSYESHACINYIIPAFTNVKIINQTDI